MLALMAMMALMGCKDSKDDPDYSKPPRIYVAISDPFNSYVYDIKGNVIYECPQHSFITKLASEGKDWYAVRSTHVDNNIPARMKAFEKPCFDKKVAWLNNQWSEQQPY